MAFPTVQQSNFNEVPRLLALIRRTGYDLLQSNGQRKYGPPPFWNGSPPPRGTEVFVGKLPRDCYEDEIVPFMEQVGKLYEMRLMMDFSGSNRGYAFVKYRNPEDAAKAITDLNNTEIREGRFVGVVKSGNNCRLFVGGLPKTKSKEEVEEAISQAVGGVRDVILYKCHTDKRKNRGFAFIEFTSHREAAMARRKLLCHKTKIWGANVAVDWAEPEVEINEEVMSKVTVLYVRNLSNITSEERLKKYFELKTKEKVERVKKIKDFAFIHFPTREAAENVLNIMNGSLLDGCTLEVTWAKPVNKCYYKLKRQSFQRNRGLKSSLNSSIHTGNHHQPSLPCNPVGANCSQNATSSGGSSSGDSCHSAPGNYIQMPHMGNRILGPLPSTHQNAAPFYPVYHPGVGESPGFYVHYPTAMLCVIILFTLCFLLTFLVMARWQ